MKNSQTSICFYMGFFLFVFLVLGRGFFGSCFCINGRTDLVITFVIVQYFNFFFNLIPILYKITKYTEKAEFVTLVHTHTVNKSFLCMALQR